MDRMLGARHCGHVDQSIRVCRARESSAAPASSTPGRLGHLWGTRPTCPTSPTDAKSLRVQRKRATGATGLEPATSGVTGRVGDQDARRLSGAERPHLQAFFAPRPTRSAWLSQSSTRRLGHEWATKCCQRRLQKGAQSSAVPTPCMPADALPQLRRLGLGDAPFVWTVRGATFQTIGNDPRERRPFPMVELDSLALAHFAPQSGALSQSELRVTGRMSVPCAKQFDLQ